MIFFRNIYKAIRNISLYEFFTVIVLGKILKKMIAFIIAITILPITIYILNIEKEPTWIKDKIKYTNTSLIITINNLNNKDPNMQAVNIIKKELYKKALKQIKISYDFDNFTKKQQIKIKQNMINFIDKLDIKHIVKQDSYKKDNHIYMLYSFHKEYILYYLQKIFSNINRYISFLIITQIKPDNNPISR